MTSTNKYAQVAKAFEQFLTIDEFPDTSSIRNAPTGKVPPDVAVGAPGMVVYQGFLLSDEKDPRLHGQKKYTLYADILANTAIVGAGARFFLSLVGKADWSVEPADDSKEAQNYADLVEDMIHDMDTPWHRVVRRAALFRFYGFGLQEWTAKMRKDGAIGIADVEARAQMTVWRWDCDMHGTVKGVVQLAPQNQREIYLPREKLVYLVDDAMHDNPEGLGLFRHLVKAADKLAAFELLEARGYESDIRGIPVMRAPLAELRKAVAAGTIDQAQLQAQLKPLQDFMRGHVKSPSLALMLEAETFRSTGEQQTPSAIKKFDVELLRGDDGPHMPIAAAIERLNREIARVLGVEHLLLGADSKGSHAMATDKSQAFGEIVDSTLVEIRAAFEHDLLTRIWELNGWPEEMMPSFCTSPIQYRDIQSVTGALADLAKAGAPLGANDPAVNQIRKIIGLADAPEQDPALVAATQYAAAGLKPDGTPLNQQDNSTDGSPQANQDGNQDAAPDKGGD